MIKVKAPKNWVNQQDWKGEILESTEDDYPKGIPIRVRNDTAVPPGFTVMNNSTGGYERVKIVGSPQPEQVTFDVIRRQSFY